MRIRPLAALAATLSLAAVPAAAHAEDVPPPTLSISGAGTVLVTPDVATLDVEVRSGSARRQTARSRANLRTQAVMAALAAQSVARTQITTTGLHLTRTQVSRRKVFYGATNTISVRLTDVRQVGPVIDAVTKAGADGVDGPQFAFSSPSAGRAEATRAALADARRRADDAAAAAGQRVTGVRSIVVDPGGDYDSASGGYAKGAADASAPARRPSTPTPVSAGRQEVTATVDVVYTIAPA
jgi:uncharacterized protein YggE